MATSDTGTCAATERWRREAFLYPDLAQLGGHHERRHAVVVEHRLQAAVRVQLGALDQQQVVHFGEEARVVLGVVGDVHQSVQHRVAARVLPPQVGFLVRVLGQVVHDVGLVGAGRQREGKLAWANGGRRGGDLQGLKRFKRSKSTGVLINSFYVLYVPAKHAKHGSKIPL